MKIALAQIDMRLGDIEGICERLERQVELAAAAGATLVCAPAPLLGGIEPGMLIDSIGFEQSLVAELERLAEGIAPTGAVLLVPAPVMFRDEPVFEVFMLKGGHVRPIRCTAAALRDKGGCPADELWSPVIDDIGGLRCAFMFEAEQTVPILPTGCDLAIRFQTRPYSAADAVSAGAAGLFDSKLPELVQKQGVWFASMEPVGSYDGAVFSGGSYVLDDDGRVVAAAPQFEEDLLVQEVCRGSAAEPVPERALASYSREEWAWRSLVLALRSAARARGTERAAVLLRGDLPSSLAAVLAVDAFGPRNVTALFVESDAVSTARQDAEERARAELVRTLAGRLQIRLIERDAADPLGAGEAHTDATRRVIEQVNRHAEGLYLETVARSLGALAVSSLTKTDCALAAEALAGGFEGDIAPFGDVYLTQLEFIARLRNRESASLPSELVSLAEIERCMAATVDRMLGSIATDAIGYGRMAQLMAGLRPSDIDAVLEAHVEHVARFEDLPSTALHGPAVALLLMAVRKGEAARRVLPMAPSVSGCSFAARHWPCDLAWSDAGSAAGDPADLEGLVASETERIEQGGTSAGERQRREIMGFLGELLGIPPEQLEQAASPDGNIRARADLEKLGEHLQEAARSFMESDNGSAGAPGRLGPNMTPLSFFSKN